MSHYNHVRNKEDLLDGMVDVVFSEIALPPSGVQWRTATRQRALSVREVLTRHPWANRFRAGEYPHLAEMAIDRAKKPGYSYGGGIAVTPSSCWE